MAKQLVTYKDRIVTDPEVMAGKPVVKGTRIPVERVIRHLADNPDINDLFEAFPHLTVEDVKACLAYAHRRLERGGNRQLRQAEPAAGLIGEISRR
jgi:uncharacterized protein (DUF433 family)